MFEAEFVVSLLKALLPKATQGQYVAFIENERTLSKEMRLENANSLEEIKDHFAQCVKKNSADALERQKKRKYILKPEPIQKNEKYFSRPAICDNKAAFDCFGCGQKSAPTYAPMHKTSEGWRLWCADCGIPQEFDKAMRDKDKKYNMYMEWRNSLKSANDNEY